MSSPFPGMDPYLEDRFLWPDVHQRLAGQIGRQLTPLLAPRYVARLSTRLVAYTPDTEEMSIFYPDVDVTTSRLSERLATLPQPPLYEPAVRAVPPVAPPPLILPVAVSEPLRLVTVEVRDVAHGRLVTAIEILSPVNKRPGEGLDEYRGKRQMVLAANAHLVEIDLLRQGVRPPRLKGLPASDYAIFVTRAERRDVTEVWPVGVRDPLPVVPVPLLPGDADVPLDLGHALRVIYDEARYDLSIDYRQPPAPPLSEQDMAWAAELLAKATERET